MGYDEKLAMRIRGLLAGNTDITERKMFGGLAFFAQEPHVLRHSVSGSPLHRFAQLTIALKATNVVSAKPIF